MHRFLVRRVNGEAIPVEAPRAHAGATSHNRLDRTRNKRKKEYHASLRDQLEESIVACTDPTALQLLVDKCVAQHVHRKTARVVKSAEERIPLFSIRSRRRGVRGKGMGIPMNSLSLHETDLLGAFRNQIEVTHQDHGILHLTPTIYIYAGPVRASG